MSRFRGKFEFTVDAKNRINIPSKFRKGLTPEANGTFVITPAQNGCLRAYPEDVYLKYESSLEAKPEVQEMLDLRRKMAAFQSDSTLDAQGRITLTQQQLQIAGIQKDLTLLGLGTYIEIWATERFRDAVGAEYNQAEFDRLLQKSIEITATPAPKQ
jgi:MraZ protein